jgi:hypothetical protein
MPFDGAAALSSLTILALKTLKTILLVPLPLGLLDVECKSFDRAMGLARLQLAAAECVLRVQTRVDGNRLRKREIDRHPALLQLIAEERAMIARAGAADGGT